MSQEREMPPVNFTIKEANPNQVKEFQKYIPTNAEVGPGAFVLMMAIEASENGIVAAEFPGVNSHNIAGQVIPEIVDELTRAGVAIHAATYKHLDDEHDFKTIILIGIHKP